MLISPIWGNFYFYFLKIIYLFRFTTLYWFCHTLTWICHGWTCAPHPELPFQTPSPSHPSGSSQCTSPEHPVSCIRPGLVIHFTYDNLHVSMSFAWMEVLHIYLQSYLFLITIIPLLLLLVLLKFQFLHCRLLFYKYRSHMYSNFFLINFFNIFVIYTYMSILFQFLVPSKLV